MPGQSFTWGTIREDTPLPSLIRKLNVSLRHLVRDSQQSVSFTISPAPATTGQILRFNGTSWQNYTNILYTNLPSGINAVALGDVIYGASGTAWARLTGNITTTRKFLRQTGTGAVSAIPVWDTLTAADVSPGTFPAGDYTFATASRLLWTDNTAGNTIGASGATRPYGVYVGTEVVVGDPTGSEAFRVLGSARIEANAGTGITFTAASSALAGDRPTLALRRARNTLASPQAITALDDIGVVAWRGHDGTSYENAFDIQVLASENWTATAHGTLVNFRTVLVGETTLTARWKINDVGWFVSAGDNLYDIGESGDNRPRDVRVARTTYPNALDVASTSTFRNHLIFTETGATLRSDTADGSDTKRIIITGGGAVSTDRGAVIQLLGNEFGSSADGFVILDAGNVAGSVISLRRAGTVIGILNATGMTLGATAGTGTLALWAGYDVMAGESTPAQFTGNQDNFTLGAFSTLRISSDASRNLTGITGGTTGRRLTLINIGAQNIVIMNDVTSTAANRFLTGTGADITMVPLDVVELKYDGTSSRWRVVSHY